MIAETESFAKAYHPARSARSEEEYLDKRQLAMRLASRFRVMLHARIPPSGEHHPCRGHPTPDGAAKRRKPAAAGSSGSEVLGARPRGQPICLLSLRRLRTEACGFIV